MKPVTGAESPATPGRSTRASAAAAAAAAIATSVASTTPTLTSPSTRLRSERNISVRRSPRTSKSFEEPLVSVSSSTRTKTPVTGAIADIPTLSPQTQNSPSSSVPSRNKRSNSEFSDPEDLLRQARRNRRRISRQSSSVFSLPELDFEREAHQAVFQEDNYFDPTSSIENMSNRGNSTDNPDHSDAGDDEDSSARALQGLLRKLGAGFETMLQQQTTGSSRFRSLLAGLKADGDLDRQFMSVQELCETLSMSTEETMAGFNANEFVPPLLELLRMEFNPEMMLLACRCLCNMIEALPTTSAVIIENGAVPLITSKLLSIEYIDLAEQCLTTLEKLSSEHSLSILKAGGLSAVLCYLDFFSMGVQRSAVTTAANLCKRVPRDCFTHVSDCIPILTNLLRYQDQKIIDKACLCFARLADNFASSTDLLLQLSAHGLMKNLLFLITPGSSVVSGGTYTMVVRVLSVLCHNCSSLALELFEANVPAVLHEILAGSQSELQSKGAFGDAAASTPGASPVAITRPTDQLFELLSLTTVILPELPKSGIFSVQLSQSTPIAAATATPSHHLSSLRSILRFTRRRRDEENASEAEADRNSSDPRLPYLNAHPDLMLKMGEQLLGTILDVYSTTVSPRVRQQCVSALLKIVYFSTPEALTETMRDIAFSSFLATLLASRDISLVAGALQLVHLCAQKLPTIFLGYFRREGVFHEIDRLASSTAASLDIKSNNAPTPTASPASHQQQQQQPTPPEEPTSGARSIADLFRRARDRTLSHASSSSSGSLFSANATTEPPQTPTKANDGEDEIREWIIQQAQQLRQTLSHHTNDNATGSVADRLTSLGKQLSAPHNTLADDCALLYEIGELFNDSGDGVSSFELFNSGFVLRFLDFLTDTSAEIVVPRSQRLQLFVHVFMGGPPVDGANSPDELQKPKLTGPVFALLVRRLNEIINKQEQFPVVIHEVAGRDSRGPMSGLKVLMQPFKLHLRSGEPSDAPDALLRDYSANVVMIEPLATVRAIEEFLWSKVVTPSGSNSSASTSSSSSRPSLSTPMDVDETSKRGSKPATPEKTDEKKEKPEEKKDKAEDKKDKVEEKKEKDKAKDKDKEKKAAEKPKVEPLSRSQRRRGRARDDELSGDANVVIEKPVEPRSSRRLRRNAERSQPAMDLDVEETPKTPSPPPPPPPETKTEETKKESEESVQGKMMEDEEVEHDEFVEDEDGEEPEHAPMDHSDEASSVLFTRAGRRGIDRSRNDSEVHDLVLHDGASETPSTAVPTSVAQIRSSQPAESSTRASSRRLSLARKTINGEPVKLQLYLRDIPLPSNMTILQAIERFGNPDKRPADRPRGSLLWQGTYTITYKLEAPRPISETQDATTAKTESADNLLNAHLSNSLPCDLSPTEQVYPVLCLLRVLNAINQHWRYTFDKITQMIIVTPISITEFVNNKLSAKVLRQLQDPLTLCSGSLADWCRQLITTCPFLFTFDCRHTYLHSTAFGVARALMRLQERMSDSSSSTDDSLENFRIGRLQRQKVRIHRSQLLQYATKVMELYASSRSVLEIEYHNEVGTGLGPTLEFYTSISHEFHRKDLLMWRDTYHSLSTTTEGMIVDSRTHVFAPCGLFPNPMTPAELTTDAGKRVVSYFRVLGQFMAKALLDNRTTDLPFSPTFYRWMLYEEPFLSRRDLADVDQSLAGTMDDFAEICRQKAVIMQDKTLDDAAKAQKLEQLGLNGIPIISLSLNFTLPGFEGFELIPNGSNVDVTLDNLDDYIERVVRCTLIEGISTQMEAFRGGFNSVVSLSDLRSFSPQELDMLFNGAEEVWDHDSLAEAIRADHGYTSDSPAIQYLIKILSEFTPTEQKKFLQFVTGSPRLPVGGLRALHPQLTVVRKSNDPPLSSDDYLPSAMTCANYLKLPDYSSPEVTRKKLLVAMTEGQGSFHLS